MKFKNLWKMASADLKANKNKKEKIQLVAVSYKFL